MAAKDEEKPEDLVYVSVFDRGTPSFLGIVGVVKGVMNMQCLETYTIPGHKGEYELVQPRWSYTAIKTGLADGPSPVMFYIGAVRTRPRVTVYQHTDTVNRMDVSYRTRSGTREISIDISGRTSKEVMEDILKVWAELDGFHLAKVGRTGCGVQPFIFFPKG
jgi:hypothetical protein